MAEKNFIIISAHDLKEAPDEFQLFPFGETMTDDGLILVDDVAMDLTIAGFQARGNDLVVDYEHQSLYGGQAPAAARITELINKKSEGLWVAVVWTQKARSFIESGEYFYFSPVSMVRQSDHRLVGLHSVALTNNPATHNLKQLVAKMNLPLEGKTEKKENKMKEALIKALKLKAEATEDDVISAVNVLNEKAGNEMRVCKEVVEVLDLKSEASVSEVVATIHALKNKGDVVSLAEFQVLKDKLAVRDRDDLVALARSQGKISPAQKDWAETYALKDPEGFKIYIEKASVVVSTGEQGGGKGTEKGDMIDEVQMQINKQLGISTEAFKKHQKAMAGHS